MRKNHLRSNLVTWQRATLLLCLFSALHCGGEEPLGSAPFNLKTAKLVALAITPGKLRLVTGGHQEYTAQATFGDGTTQDVTAQTQWDVQDVTGSGVAAISATGAATAQSAGTARIVAHFRGQVTHAPLKVTDKPELCTADDWCRRNPVPTSGPLAAIWGANANNLWAVGDRGTILKWNGTSWTQQESGISEKLESVWGSDLNNVWAVSREGTILKGDYDPAIRTYTDPRMEMSCGLPRNPT